MHGWSNMWLESIPALDEQAQACESDMQVLGSSRQHIMPSLMVKPTIDSIHARILGMVVYACMQSGCECVPLLQVAGHDRLAPHWCAQGRKYKEVPGVREASPCNFPRIIVS